MVKIANSVSQYSIDEIDDGLDSSDNAKALCRKAAAESCVLLKNDGVLPLAGKKVAVFGRVQYDWFYVGYGSGGEVKPPYRVNLIDGLKNSDIEVDVELAGIYAKWREKHLPFDGVWGMWPYNYDEMPIKEKLVESASARCDAAIVVIGRSAGEDRENRLSRGSWYLTEHEDKLLSIVSKHFQKVCVVINSGSLIDVSFIKKYNVGALLYAWQGGQESGNGVADVLSGKVSPCGKLPDTIAEYGDYPSAKNFGNKQFNYYSEDIYVGYRYFETFAKDKVIFPFGFGLSYTTFDISASVTDEGDKVKITATVLNTGNCASREVIQVYCGAPQGKLGKPEKVLVAYKKTDELLPGESKSYELSFDKYFVASFDDTGVTGNPYCFVLEGGEYAVYVGSDVRSSAKCGSFTEDATHVVKKSVGACGVKTPFDRLVNRNGAAYEAVPKSAENLRAVIEKNRPYGIEYTGDKGYKLTDVKNGRVTLDEFIAQLDEDELEQLTRGGNEGMYSPQGASGNAGVMGGTLPSLRDKGIPPVCTNDGPSGARLQAHSTLIPIGTALASTFDDELVFELLKEIGKEVKDRGSHVLLAPGMNIHRNPLCGRNFEYFSEDPVLAGSIATAYVNGVQTGGSSAVIKHFACNNQETGRLINDSVVSQRALREIYLRPFELAVKQSNPHFIMASYNKINGVWSCYNYDLCTRILREDWGYDGCVMTDWWIKYDKSPYFENVDMQAYRVQAQVDVFMPGGARSGKYKNKSDGTLINSLHSDDGITLGEVQRSVKNVLNYCLRHML